MDALANRVRKTTIAIAALVALAVGGVVLAKVARAGDDAREIRLVARDMSYFVENTHEPNPTLRLKRGEKIRLVLTNGDQGYSHNLVSPVLRLSTPLLDQGESQSMVLTVPDVAGVSAYTCDPHAEMMKGVLIIE